MTEDADGHREELKASPQTSAKKEPVYASAMDKVRDEMAKGKGRYVQVVGEFLTDYLQRHPEAETAILTKGKTIAGSLEEMKKEAKKEAVNGCGVLDDETAFGIVLKYFGINPGQNVLNPGQNVLNPGGNVIEAQKPTALDPFDLDALLGAM